MVDMNIFDQQFWKDAWDNDPNTQDKRMKRAGLGNPDAPGFEKWAENFNKNSFTEESQKRTKRIMSWIENQTGAFKNLSILDVGAASGVFSIPFAKEGAKVTSLEPSTVLHEMLKDNAQHYDASIKTINQSFESISASDLNNVDFVFASMCPAVTTWEAVQKAIDIANQFVYVSLIAGPKENSIVEKVTAFLEMKPSPMTADMYYLMQLLYCNNYTYDTLIEHHTQHTEKSVEEVMQQLPSWLKEVEIEIDHQQMESIEQYLQDKYGDNVPLTTGGKFGKVLIHL
ncbi:class I SAM-dependent methyltransferase [Staphylococcus caprae]|uniref:Methyltransferase domain-containing protein n=2 Tax=Staphylococcus caprae TaxID=29380 RepID=A0ABN5W1B5_9STAP|nr:class I SAM-dependent methyltransferase [Staphylococcus caprae]MBN6826376.1 class I SAM-dependent methyltransferase [Staphylococcus caprae]MBX5317729.1 class I SAM-dependent methyltransferase [Staphylococcus caprae]MBX5323425.1 class I SAM-dependent methyltransferase [Staphylococcus caprae]PAK64602.1 SAM-dependent methyltransferase [Staphylococcus caprae]QDW92995.1 class I SAM-dependent methyltransferase [Staphylococcus caprae]